MSVQRGAVLIIALVFLMLVTLLATSSMQNATLQEKVAGSLQVRTASFQTAEAVLRAGEASVLGPSFAMPECAGPRACLPPPEALTLSGAGSSGGSSVSWVASEGGVYGVQYLGQTDDPVRPGKSGELSQLYRVTAVVIQGTSRTVLESIHTQERRIMWRQRQ